MTRLRSGLVAGLLLLSSTTGLAACASKEKVGDNSISTKNEQPGPVSADRSGPTGGDTGAANNSNSAIPGGSGAQSRVGGGGNASTAGSGNTGGPG